MTDADPPDQKDEPPATEGNPSATEEKSTAGEPSATEEKSTEGDPSATEEKSAAGDPAAPRLAWDVDTAELDKSAADDPTAVWDEQALRDAGLDELRDEQAVAAPATGPDVKGDSTQSVVVGRGGAPGFRARQQATRPPPSQGLSWPMTIALALALGAAVYFLVRLLQ